MTQFQRPSPVSSPAHYRQSRIINWAVHLLKFPEKFCVLDTETTGLEGEVIDLAILSGSGETLFDEIIKPVGIISAAASRVHHLTAVDVAHAPTFAEVCPRVIEILNRFNTILVYNASFDAGRLHHSARVHGLRIKEWHRSEELLLASNEFQLNAKWSCVMERYAEYYGERGPYGSSGSYKWQSLRLACQQMRVQHDNWHRALGDAQATLKLVQALAALRVPPVDGEEALDASDE